MRFTTTSMLVFLFLIFVPIIAGFYGILHPLLENLGTFERVIVTLSPFVFLMILVFIAQDRDTIFSLYAQNRQR